MLPYLSYKKIKKKKKKQKQNITFKHYNTKPKNKIK